ncbi:MAG: glycosyltransferase [Hydrococcus sp. SU_1_0]|nr:glycosyltransferase [Hydrococcus sp. SU_1_0]NJO95115.1 glycosyltransferase [Pleurocapsa sp. CRU_1_2]
MKNKPTLTIFYQFDPWRSSIGGIQTFICSFLKYAPPEFEVRLVGTGDQNAVIGKWTEKDFLGRSVKFMPLIKVEKDDVRKLIPTTLKYTAALFRHNLSSDFMHFNRLETALATRSWQGEKILFVHNDIQKQMSSRDGNNAILWQKFPQAYFALENFLIEQFNYIYSCHSETAEFYQRKYPKLAQSISYLKNTVDEEIFYPLSSDQQIKSQNLAKKMGLAANTRFILFAGRLHPQKDPLLLIKAFASLSLNEELNIHLLIAGAGELKSEITVEIAKFGLTEKVTMLGAVPQSELAKLHRVSSVFVLSSVYEGLPLTVLEALSSGTPIVTTNSGETPKFLGADSGIVCHQRTPEAIADALVKILHNPDLYPSTACVKTAKPYSAKTVVTEVYQNMFERWESSGSSSRKVHLPLSLTS